MKKIVFILLVLLIITPLHANTKQLITIVRGQDFPPYHYLNQSELETGFIIEIIQAVAGDLGIDVKFEQHSWSRCILMVKSGKADAMMNLFKTEERKKFMYFSNNILGYETNQFFKRAKSVFQYSGKLSELASYKIGAIINYSYGSKFDRTQFDNIFRLETEKDLIKSLANKRSDAIIGNTVVIKLLLNKMGLEKTIEPVLPVVSKEPLYIGFSKTRGHKQLSENFSDALTRFKNSESYKLILKSYNQ